MTKIYQEDLIYKNIFKRIASDGWQSIDLESLSQECDFDVLNVTGGIRNKVDLLVAFSAFIDMTVNQSIDADLKDDQIPLRERLLEALLIRFEALAPYKAGVIKLMKTFPPNPSFVAIGLKSLKLSMEATLTAVGLEADFVDLLQCLFEAAQKCDFRAIRESLDAWKFPQECP